MKDQKKTVQQNALTSLSPAELRRVVGGGPTKEPESSRRRAGRRAG